MDASLLLVFCIAVTWIGGAAVVNIAYRRNKGQVFRFTEETSIGAFTREVALFVFMVGIPFIALILGISGLDLMALGQDLANPSQLAGFTFISWVRGVGVSVTTVVSILLTLWLASRSAPLGEPWGVGIIAFRDAIYDETHWTFYRAGPALLLHDPYWGMVAGAVLVILEWLVHPESLKWLTSLEGRQYLTLRLACLICSGFLYLAISNLWLMIVANLVIQIVGNRLLSGSGRSKQAIEN